MKFVWFIITLIKNVLESKFFTASHLICKKSESFDFELSIRNVSFRFHFQSVFSTFFEPQRKNRENFAAMHNRFMNKTLNFEPRKYFFLLNCQKLVVSVTITACFLKFQSDKVVQMKTLCKRFAIYQLVILQLFDLKDSHDVYPVTYRYIDFDFDFFFFINCHTKTS